MSVRLGLRTRLAQAKVFVIMAAPPRQTPLPRCDLLGLTPGEAPADFVARWRAVGRTPGAIRVLAFAPEHAAELNPDAVLVEGDAVAEVPPDAYRLLGALVHDEAGLRAGLAGRPDFLVVAGSLDLIAAATRAAPVTEAKPWFAWPPTPSAAIRAGAARVVLTGDAGRINELAAQAGHLRRRLATVWSAPELEAYALRSFRLR